MDKRHLPICHHPSTSLTRRSFLSALVALFIASVLFGCAGSKSKKTGETQVHFDGVIKASTGIPLSGARVTIGDWETLTDGFGHWSQDRLVICANKGDDTVIISAKGFRPAQVVITSQYPAWRSTCPADQALHFETVLDREIPKVRENQDATRYKPKRFPVIPWGKK